MRSFHEVGEGGRGRGGGKAGYSISRVGARTYDDSLLYEQGVSRMAEKMMAICERSLRIYNIQMSFFLF